MLCRDDGDGGDVSAAAFFVFSPRLVALCYAADCFLSLPSMSDSARKRKLADFVVSWKKQVVKLYAVTKWSRDADIVQKCMVRRQTFLVLGGISD